MDLKPLLVVAICIGCSPTAQPDSAAVHIDKLREQVNDLTKERDELREQLSASKLKHDELMLAMSRFKETATKEPALAIGRYLRALRRYKFDVAQKHPQADLTINPYLRDPKGGAFFLVFAKNVRDAGGEIPEGISGDVDLSGFSDSETKDVADTLSLDKAIAKSSSEDETNLIYFNREMKRLGKFSDGIVTQ